ncbi:hypothetical protein OHAE_1216 [Ochrobactrum soli]|uniref:Uncharacterized protein n=1 Tax=Ochrobactrum soli TaxID=2448455 RepID=A0A2P9HMR9_9HYPH|nr:hypothetical protein OHAE_1216 [[Ochrobactrum] soli]
MAVLEEHAAHLEPNNAGGFNIEIGAQKNEARFPELPAFLDTGFKRLCRCDIQIDDSVDVLRPVNDAREIRAKPAQLNSFAEFRCQNGDYALQAVVPSEEASTGFSVNADPSH